MVILFRKAVLVINSLNFIWHGNVSVAWGSTMIVWTETQAVFETRALTRFRTPTVCVSDFYTLFTFLWTSQIFIHLCSCFHIFEVWFSELADGFNSFKGGIMFVSVFLLWDSKSRCVAKVSLINSFWSCQRKEKEKNHQSLSQQSSSELEWKRRSCHL